MNRRMLGAAVAASVFVVTSAANAAPHLVGFLLYKSDPAGNSLNAPFYFYSSNTSIFASRQALTPQAGPSQSTSISIPLLDGANTITFSTTEPFNPGTHAGVQLYFNDTGEIFNPLAVGITADLAAYVPTGTSLLTNVDAGRMLVDYGNSRGPLVAYSGATSFQVGDQIITISSLSIDSLPSGSITIDVRPIPAPASLALLAATGLGVARRRRQRALQPLA